MRLYISRNLFGFSLDKGHSNERNQSGWNYYGSVLSLEVFYDSQDQARSCNSCSVYSVHQFRLSSVSGLISDIEASALVICTVRGTGNLQ